MAEATKEHFPDSHHDVSANTIFGFWVYLMTDFIMFATFFATYAVLRNNTFGGPTAKELLDIHFAFGQTLVLLLSSFTCGLAMLAIPQGKKGSLFAWYGITFLLGAVFLYMVGIDFARLIASGNDWTKNAFLTSYFSLIGLHGLHIVAGLIFMVFFLVQVGLRGLVPVTIRRLTCLKLFWFFSYVVWIFMFTIVYLIGAT
jgi:cytochrome o ubiquinol oxidase subunit III